MRVLICDDSRPIREVLRDLLEDNGYEVVAEAENGQQAVGMAMALAPDVVLMDMRMPVMDGLEATRQLRKLDGPPVVLLSAYDDPGHMQSSIEAGAIAQLNKGLPVSELTAALNELIGGDE
jgi:two-component system, response regulator PdtaR